MDIVVRLLGLLTVVVLVGFAIAWVMVSKNDRDYNRWSRP